VANDFPIMATTSTAREVRVVFIDEIGFMLVPTVRRTYAPSGADSHPTRW
jgi:hypothetical protein